jgi:hypothetical protein
VVDELARDVYQARMTLHRKARWRNHCKECRDPWPCYPHRAARSAFDLGTGRIGLNDANTVYLETTPLLTSGQRWRTNREYRDGGWR